MIHQSYLPIYLYCESDYQCYYCYLRRCGYVLQYYLYYHLDNDCESVIQLQHLHYHQ